MANKILTVINHGGDILEYLRQLIRENEDKEFDCCSEYHIEARVNILGLEIEVAAEWDLLEEVFSGRYESDIVWQYLIIPSSLSSELYSFYVPLKDLTWILADKFCDQDKESDLFFLTTYSLIKKISDYITDTFYDKLAEIVSERKKNSNLAKQTERKRERKLEEHRVRDKLSKALNGRTEVETPAGDIDVLTDKEIIEIKEAISWKDAIGQVIAYQNYYPSRKKRIHLFKMSKRFRKEVVESVCKLLDIKVTYEE